MSGTPGLTPGLQDNSGSAENPSTGGPSRFVPMGSEPELTDLERTGAGPGRFHQPDQGEAPPSVLTRLGYLLAIVAIVVGIPALLWWLNGPPPIPTSLPSRADLTQPIGLEQVLTVLVAVVWVAWLQFVVCLAVEFLSAIRGGGVPTAIPLSGPSQRLARVLVGGVLLVGVLGGQVAAVFTSTGGVADRAASSVSGTATPGQGTGPTITPSQQVAVDAENVLAASERAAASTPSGPTMSVTAVAGDQDLVGHKVYTVKPPTGHYHDNLWDIAERHLGDGKRYKEIYDLNKDRAQPDGKALHLARLIQPGWQLVMPEDAVGVARLASPDGPGTAAPAVDRGAGAVVQDVSVGGGSDAGGTVSPEAAGGSGGSADSGVTDDGYDAAGDTVARSQLAAPDAVDDRVEADGAAAAGDIVGNPLVGGLATGGIFAATLGIALAIRRARSGGGARPGDAAREAEVGILTGADTDRAAWLDAALRSLAATCAQTGKKLPPVIAVLLGDDRIQLLLDPARTDAPAPWAVVDNGRRWELARADLLEANTAATAPYPALVCLGRDHQGRDVLLDLESAGGPIQVTGDPNTSVQVASALAVQLSSLPWSDGMSVLTLGLPREVGSIAGPRMAAALGMEGVVTDLESAFMGQRGVDVLAGRLNHLQAENPRALVVADPVEPILVERLAAISRGVERMPVGSVVVGPVPGARWQLQVDASGSMRIPTLGTDVVAHRLLDSQLAAVSELFDAADQAVRRTLTVREPVPSVPYATDDILLSSAPVSVSLLGPLTVRARDGMEASRLPLAEELVAYLACQPGGVHPGVLSGAIWPRGVTHAVATATIERVREWLGTAADGTARLREDENGRLSLSPDVAVDWYAVCGLVERSRSTRTERQEAEMLRRALRLARGPFLQDRPQGRYGWLARTDLDRTAPALLVDAAHRLVEISSAADPVDAAVAARVGLRVDVTAQLLWRDLIEVQNRQGGPAAVRVVVDEMHQALDRIGVAVDAETEALVEHLTAGSAPAQA